MMTAEQLLRNRVGGLTKAYGTDHPTVLEARRELAMIKFGTATRKILAEIDSLSERQRQQLRADVEALAAELAGERAS